MHISVFHDRRSRRQYRCVDECAYLFVIPADEIGDPPDEGIQVQNVRITVQECLQFTQTLPRLEPQFFIAAG
jgi:hypothetical protein